jgi:hypothetical protein
MHLVGFYYKNSFWNKLFSSCMTTFDGILCHLKHKYFLQVMWWEVLISHLGPYKIHVTLVSVSEGDKHWLISFFLLFIFSFFFIPCPHNCVVGYCSCICNFMPVLLGTVHLTFCVIFVSSKWFLPPLHFSTLLKVGRTWSDYSAPSNAAVNNEFTYTTTLLCAYMA